MLRYKDLLNGIYMTTEQAFNVFLDELTQSLQSKSKALCLASWNLETHGSKANAEEVAKLDQKLGLFFADEEKYRFIKEFKETGNITSPHLLRILKLLEVDFKNHQVPHELIEKMAQLESELSHSYVCFRVDHDGKKLGENDLIDCLKNEADLEKRRQIWLSMKKIGHQQAPGILKLVKLRNQKAHRLGYSDFYQMQLKSQEVDKKWLFDFLQDFAQDSKQAYQQVCDEIEESLCKKFQVKPASLGPWAWNDPFCQEDPLEDSTDEGALQGVDLVSYARQFFHSMGFEIDSTLSRSDLYERENKNQHAFCTHIDRLGDIRILTNLRPNLRWLDTLFHELGHAVYEQGYDTKLPWLLKTPPHMITTEAIALIMGRSAYDPQVLKQLNPQFDTASLERITQSTRRRQLIFSRWVLVMAHFEANLYQNPEQDLNKLWWSLVQQHQKIIPPSHRSDHFDWACKYHVGLAPVYYHSYLLGEFFASMLAHHFHEQSESSTLYGQTYVSEFLNEKLFAPGNSVRWDRLIEQVVQKPLDYHHWIEDFKS